MANYGRAKPPIWYWIVAIVSTLWSLAGCFAYYTQVSMRAADLAQLPPAQQQIWGMMPAWVTGAYAIAVWIGLAGSLSLLARKAWARPLFIVSLIAVLAQFGWTFFASPILKTDGPAGSLPIPACIILIVIALVWFSGFATRRGWLR
jgi:hypothetical protein